MTMGTMAKGRILRAGAILGAAMALAGCLQRDLAALIPCTVSGVVQKVNVENVDKVDFLFVIDNSGSMKAEQKKLQTQLPHLVEVLASGDRDGDGNQDFPPVKNLRIGVATVDLGVGSFTGQANGACDEIGDDGLLITRTGDIDGSPPPGCGANGYGSGQKFVDYEPESATENASDFANRVACVAVVGAGGCGFEQQLEAPLKALTPATSSITFAGGTQGNGDVNAFLREDSLLAILLVTDEEDCSAADYDIFNVESSKYPLPNGDSNYHNVHCYLGEAPEKALHPVQRYIDGFLALRPNNSGLLVFGAITGVPLAFDDGGTSFTDLLKDPSMSYSEVQKASNLPYELKPVCDAGADGDAAPARRIVQVAQGLDAAGAGVTVRSICAPDYAPALDAIIRKIADALGGACLPRKLNPDAGGNVNCDVVEVLPLGVTCESLSGKGRSFLRSEKIDGESEPREVCRIAQLPAISTGDAAANPPSDPGWFYEFDDDANPNGNGGNPTDLEKRCGQGSQRISFASDSEPGTGSQLRLECLQPVVGSANGQVDVGEGCSAQGANAMCNAGSSLGADQCPTDVSLVCDPKSLTWQAPCDDDSDCSPFVCDTTRTFSDGTAAPSICVNPTCG